jgi:hypothetical protein
MRMTAPALRLVPTVDEVRDRLPDMPHVNLPSFQDVGRQADATVGRLRGRPARPGWLRPLLVVGVVGVLVAIAATAMTWARHRPRRWIDDDVDGLTVIGEPIGVNPDLGGDPSGLGGFGSPGLATSEPEAPARREAKIR